MSLVAPSAIVGVVSDVEYTIPRSVTNAPPSAVTFPPKVAEVVVIELAAVVVTVGAELLTAAVITTKSSIDHPPKMAEAGVKTISSISANEPVVGDVKSKVMSEL